ncbi:DNA helicase II [Marinagarivorans cellulosilyticus]|uniref:DNA 3'-5' helicase n=1 Tax=Marinagarivorans cellulosilyticus TaxID=2721545 RepID=A0AAN2BK16_9GAMM|nr:DNA helicase II [Marinagarivorans cellulosilyticus]BCD97531.1 DNA helicase II / ATP-dependent DNA helicase PcrA [Marinagarivorans cellulosilyticus]
MDITHLTDSLNTPQREAVCASPCHQLILAGAGSGKTRVLVHRIAYLIQVQGVAPNQIMAVTFTNKAAREMRERLQQLLGDVGGPNRFSGLWVGTFHGIAHRLLKMHWREAKLPENFQILDSDDQLRVIKRVYQALQIDEKRWPHRQAQYFINGSKDEGLRAQHIQDSHDPYTTTMKMIYSAYEEACQNSGLVDFAELLLRSHELWLSSPELLKHYQDRFVHLLVDEFQDTNSVQYAWLRVLAGNACWVTGVGDDDQSIYGWRGAKIENIQQFEKDFSNTAVTKLEQNYRSTNTILSAANAVIQNNNSRLGKQLWTEDGDGDPIDLYSAFNEQDEARYIAECIEQWQKEGNSLASSAVLYRSNAQSRVLEETFLREGIAYRIYGGQRFYERMEIKNALAYVRLVLNRHDDPAFERVINTPTRGIGEKSLEALRLTAREQGCSLFDAAAALLANNVLPARAANCIKAFLALLDELQGGIDSLGLAEQVEYVINASGLYEFHQKEKGERGQARIENLQELVNACRAFNAEDADRAPIAEFVDNAALGSGEQQADEYQDAVQMMTLHSAKGLEFPLVFIAGVEENLFPHKMSADSAEGLEEERRLCYVGITRAMKKLVLTHAESRRLYGSETYNPLSRFIREIPEKCIQEVRLKAVVTRPANVANVRKDNALKAAYSDEGDGEFKLGQRVAHAKFGEGVILQFEGRGPGARVNVAFTDAGSKWLMMQYAKLQAVER